MMHTATATPRQAAPQGVASDPAHQLEAILHELISVHERLLEQAHQRRDAMRRADMQALASGIERESQLVQEVAEIEKRRLRVVGALAERMGSERKTQTTVTWIAERLDEPLRGPLYTLAHRLRGLVKELRGENETARAAAEMLALHMQGLMRQVSARLSHTHTYGRAGSVEVGARVVTSLDLTS